LKRIKKNCHNYGPLLTKYFSVKGFGDFATDERFRAKTTKHYDTRIVRYYIPTEYLLKFFKATNTRDYEDAKNILVNSTYWNTISNLSHQQRCKKCYEVANNKHKRSPTYWKKFKILHYLSCITNETVKQFSNVVNAEDLDPEGYNTIIKS